MTTLPSPEAVTAYVGAVGASFVGAVAYTQTRSTARDGQDYDQLQANLRELRATTNAATSFKSTIVPELRTLDYYLDRARIGEPLPPLRVALSLRLDSMYGERTHSLPSAFEHVQAAYEGALGQVLRIDEISWTSTRSRARCRAAGTRHSPCLPDADGHPATSASEATRTGHHRRQSPLPDDHPPTLTVCQMTSRTNCSASTTSSSP
ncbi:hypothetical protein [Streptomyces sp. NPDC088196]|uniref:hypothetical protein n=1 Tax=Streptomyces sp. NPDC088196 TaxID=3154868 RepID=UPI00344ECEC1